MFFLSVLLAAPGYAATAELERLDEFRIARAVERMVAATRKIYTAEVARKLTADGYGADADYHDIRGHVPLPVRFVHMIADEFYQINDKEISVALKSKYFINPENRLVTDKDKEAWSYFEELQKTPKGMQKVHSTPYLYRESSFLGDYLVYVGADLGTDQGCVNCHSRNEYEKSVAERRKEYGVKGQPILKLDYMMGLVVIRVQIL